MIIWQHPSTEVQVRVVKSCRILPWNTGITNNAYARDIGFLAAGLPVEH
jgi:hypothetical protein